MVLSGIATVIYKSQSDKMKPSTMLLIQIIISSVSFVIITTAMGDFYEMFRIGTYPFLALLSAAILGIIFGNLMYLTSLKLIGVSKAYPIAMTYPLLTYILEIIFLDGEFKWFKILGIVFVIIGVVFISLSKVNGTNKIAETIETSEKNENDLSEIIVQKPSEITSEVDEITANNSLKKKSRLITAIQSNKNILGITLAALTTITWASGTTLIAYGLSKTDVDVIPISAARMPMLIPIAFLIFMLNTKKEDRKNFEWKSKSTWLSILLIAIGALMSLVAANVLYLLSIEKLESTSIPAVIAASGPLVTTPLSKLFLKEKVDWKIFLGTLLTIGGMVMVLLIT